MGERPLKAPVGPQGGRGGRHSEKKPVFYHCISRVVDRRFVLGVVEKERFRTLMRMQEKFTGGRVVSYCLMDNHFHLLLEVPSMAEDGLTDGELLRRLGAIYSEAFVAGVAAELAEARKLVKEGRGEESVLVGRIHGRFAYRMHDLGEFMKGLLQRFTQWFNRAHKGCGADDSIWANDVSQEYRKLLMAGAVEKTVTRIGRDGAEETRRTRKGMGAAVIGSRVFVNEAFANARDRFGKNRRDGARKMRGDAAAATGGLWSLRDLRKGI